ncbi:MAG: hypothetical protein JSU63_16580 [Phycisphaerales bacterium]|nr:MAG: hypothetical protein JSU63_16580 [Phycisphaerales bacterium]
MVQRSTNFENFFDEVPEENTHAGCGRCGAGEAEDEELDSQNSAVNTLPSTAVRFGYMRYIGDFTYSPEMRFAGGAKLVIQTKRGIEIGEQVPLTCSGCDRSVSPEGKGRWVDQCGPDSFIFNAGRILREATAADLAEYARIQAGCLEKKRFAHELAQRLDLAIRVVECEYLFGGERIIFFFIAPERVDYRALVKDLAREYRTRIEMRQIGARDEARLLGDYETCGRPLCCKAFLKTLKPISMRMAKVQKATLDPSQVSGRCGRLKCCLRYEHSTYEELDERLPRSGARIRTEHGDGVVVNRQILTQLVQIRTDASELLTVAAEDILKPGESRREVPKPAGADALLEDSGEAEQPVKRGSRRPRRSRKPKPDVTDSRAREKAPGTSAQPTAGTDQGNRKAGGDGDAGSTRRKRRRRPRRRRAPRDGKSNGGPVGPAGSR